MTHTQTQGADGTGTKTAKPGDLLYRSEWETKRTITHEDAREIAGRLIASRFRRTDCETARASIPANPDYDDDLLINSYIKQQARKDAALAAPAPAATPGVPDSLRALSEAATPGPWNHRPLMSDKGSVYRERFITDEKTNLADDMEPEDAEFVCALVNWFRSISTQPAGQAGDAGAVARANLFEMLWRDAEDEAQRLEAGMKPSRDQIAEAFHEHRRERQPNLPQWSEVDQNSGAAKFAHAFVDRLLSIRPEEPAPNCTRTGAAETEVVEAVARAIFDADEDVNDAKEAELRAKGNHVAADCLAGPRARWDDPRNAPILDAFRHRARKAIEALAARPEAPSDAGWRDISTAPKDGTRLWLFYPARSEDDRQQIGWWERDTAEGVARWIDHADAMLIQPSHWRPRPPAPTPPSDPAPSGQAEG